MTTESHFQRRFQTLSRLAVAASGGRSADQLLELAVTEAASLVGLVAGTVRLFGAEGTDMAGAIAGEPEGKQKLAELEETLLGQLRRNYSVRSLFMTLDLDGPAGLFSYPLMSGTTVVGAVSGLARGERNLAAEEEFVASLAAMIVLICRASGYWAEPSRQEAEVSIRTKAVQETAATINHEINNPLMAVIGNVELLLRRDALTDPDAREKLNRVHEAATRIHQVTQNLMRISNPRSVPYPGGSSMIDLSGSPRSDEKK